MGSSNKKKREKKKDFQKPKLKVGKAKPKASNFTDTSFKSKSVILAHQSLSENAPDPAQQFKHNLSLAATSRSDNQRRDALSFLVGQLSVNPPNNPVGTPMVLNRLLPLISDGSGSVRSQLLKLFKTLPAPEVRPVADRVILYVRAGMTHLSKDIRDDALNVLEWLLDVAGLDVVSCPGGWVKTLNTFGAMMGWVSSPAQSAAVQSNTGWTSAPKTTFGAEKGGSSYARQLSMLAKFLEVGFLPEEPVSWETRGYWDNLYRPHKTTNPFSYLNLYGNTRNEDDDMYEDQEDRQNIFANRWQAVMIDYANRAKKEGGAVGRAAAALDQALNDGMKDFDGESISIKN